MHRCWSHLTRISQILPITLKHSVLHSTMSWMGPGSNKSLPTHLPVKHVCSECGCIRNESFPGNYSLNQHLVLGRVRHWCLPELGHTALPGSGFKRQSWNYPCNYKMELKMMPKNRGSLAPAKPLPHNAVTRDSRTLPAQAVPEHTWRWHNLAHSVHPTGTNPAAPPLPEPWLPPHKTQCMWNAALHLLRHRQAPENSDTSQWPKGILSRNNSSFIGKCYDVRQVFLKIIWFLAILFYWLHVLHQHSGKNTAVTPSKIYLPFSSLWSPKYHT